MKNDDKNQLKGKQFSKDYQPSPEAKSEGWERKRVSKEMMDKVYEYLKLPANQLRRMAEELADKTEDSNKYTALEMKVLTYILKEKFTTDLFNRAVSYAPKEVDLTSGGEPIQSNREEMQALAKGINDLLNREDEISGPSEEDSKRDS